jgi:serine/threonine protein kinase
VLALSRRASVAPRGRDTAAAAATPNRALQGSLREALDCGLLAKPGGFLPPSAVLALAHDVSAAMLHLHSEGIVHGDLKAGNVMLTSSGAGGCSSGGLSNPRVWAGAPGDRPLTAKVADFGLAFPLPPTDTHATLLARVRGALVCACEGLCTSIHQAALLHCAELCRRHTPHTRHHACGRARPRTCRPSSSPLATSARPATCTPLASCCTR